MPRVRLAFNADSHLLVVAKRNNADPGFDVQAYKEMIHNMYPLDPPNTLVATDELTPQQIQTLRDRWNAGQVAMWDGNQVGWELITDWLTYLEGRYPGHFAHPPY